MRDDRNNGCEGDYTEPGLVEETIRIKEQPGNENDLEPSTTIAGKVETTKTQLSSPDEEFQRLSGVIMRIQQKDHFKEQIGLNDLSGCIMTREEMRLVALILA